MGFLVKTRYKQKAAPFNKAALSATSQQMLDLLGVKAYKEAAASSTATGASYDESFLKLQSYSTLYQNWHQQLAGLNAEVNELRAYFDESHSKLVNVEGLHQTVAQWKQTPGALFGYGCNPPQAFEVAGYSGSILQNKAVCPCC
jgi:hypothetical protein